MKTEEKLRRILDSRFDHPQIEITHVGPTGLYAVVLSNVFETMDEGERQRLVWEAAEEGMSPDELSEVEFIFTVAPNDPADLDEEE